MYHQNLTVFKIKYLPNLELQKKLNSFTGRISHVCFFHEESILAEKRVLQNSVNGDFGVINLKLYFHFIINAEKRKDL